MAAHFTACPFCKVVQPPPAAPRAGPVKCATCKRPYNAALEECPFCARTNAGYREVVEEPAPRHEAFKAARAEIEEGEQRVRSIAGWTALAVVVSIPFAIALSSKVHGTSSLHLGLSGGLAFCAAIGLAWLLPRVFGYEGLELGRRAGIFLIAYVASIPLSYFVVTTTMLATAGAPKPVSCTATGFVYARRSYGTPTSTRFVCTLPDGGLVSGAEGRANMPFALNERFTMNVRPSLGGWLYEPDSARVDRSP